MLFAISDSAVGFLFFMPWVLSVIGSTLIGIRLNRAAEGLALGALLGPVGLLITGVALPRRYRRRCPDCYGGIPDRATKCRHCGSAV